MVLKRLASLVVCKKVETNGRVRHPGIHPPTHPTTHPPTPRCHGGGKEPVFVLHASLPAPSQGCHCAPPHAAVAGRGAPITGRVLLDTVLQGDTSEGQQICCCLFLPIVPIVSEGARRVWGGSQSGVSLAWWRRPLKEGKKEERKVRGGELTRKEK
ncbi:hypothetical protein E2C01_010350 [Portunus trituberculatus]|uniref:Uncharacterized protein n=1 Tax=Portunus trituberculatus TaxID=210409 RepID=A0A5B7D841_PORTR|nr:hypothetical protein [Portunus trituberculatus]